MTGLLFKLKFLGRTLNYHSVYLQLRVSLNAKKLFDKANESLRGDNLMDIHPLQEK